METQLPPPMVLYRLATRALPVAGASTSRRSSASPTSSPTARRRHEALREGHRHARAVAPPRAPPARHRRRARRGREDGRFELTPVGSFLKSGPGSFRAAAQLFGGPMVWQSWGDLLTTVRTGETGARTACSGRTRSGTSTTIPEEAAVFDEAMGSFTAMTAIAVAAAYDFSSMRKLVDVGGGAGRAPGRHPPREPEAPRRRLRPAAAGRGRAAARSPPPASRIAASSSAATSSRRSPPGSDAYMLKHVIHDWDDAKATRILRTCRAAMGPEAKLLIVEGVYPPRIDGSPESRGRGRATTST